MVPYTFDELLKNGNIEYFKGKEYFINTLKKNINIDVISSSGIKIFMTLCLALGRE